MVLFAIAMWFLAILFPVSLFKTEPHALFPLLMIAVGLLVILLCAATFIRKKTTLNPIRPESTTILISSGLYQYSRNPIYLGFVIILAGWGMYLNNIPALLLIAGFIFYMDRFQIELEEQLLSQIFGDQFEIYKRSVRRWL
ncbi:Protein-S-isoprenylcysteine O-methyltransferase Ste14 [Nitrosomonas marina]|uniref:Protein-S-isoprenylcysteine O-methyltransferase Ste14 n=2 Tax=Nitrosomonas marina TaxID=917 RepID=A0A1H8DKC3_9PROT|nr:Protein-S-isoprenylcysteine O-methyltransferase Ste14 [Nitrosomonas marina]